QLYDERALVWTRALAAAGAPEAAERWDQNHQRDIVLFDPEERSLWLRPRRELPLARLDLTATPPREVARRVAPESASTPIDAALHPDGSLYVGGWRGLEVWHASNLADETVAPRLSRSRYPLSAFAVATDGTLVRHAPQLHAWFDLNDDGPLYGVTTASRRVGESWQDVACVELLGECQVEHPEERSLRVVGDTVLVLHPHPTEYGRVQVIRMPAGLVEDAPLAYGARACLAPDGEALLIAEQGTLRRVPLAAPRSGADAARFQRRRRLEALTSRGGSQWAWRKIVRLLDEAEPDERAALVEQLGPTLAAWRADERPPPKSWPKDHPGWSLVPLRRVAAVTGQVAAAETTAGLLLIEGELDEGRVRLLPARGPARLLSALTVVDPKAHLRPTAPRITADGACVVARVAGTDPAWYCEDSDVTDKQGGHQILVVRDGEVTASLRDKVKGRDSRRQDLDHSAVALDPAGRGVWTWLFGHARLRRHELPTLAVQAELRRKTCKDLAVSPDGRLLLVADYPASLLLDAQTLAPLQTIEVDGQPLPASHAAFEPDGRHALLVRRGPQRWSARFGATDLEVHRLCVDADRLTPVARWTDAVPLSAWATDPLNDDRPRVETGLHAVGDAIWLVWAVQNDNQIGVIELPSRRRATLDTVFHGPVSVAPSGAALFDIDGALMRWRPTLQP
ncbi:MAG: hypothetical protein KC636_32100, partial [Myxococcales bacterium]|nr:hypothetical protein [Myxococcales bacterium]